MVDFWSHSGWHLLKADEAGDLVVTPAFVRAYFLRPEVMPEDGSCAGEIALHEAITEDPLRRVDEAEIAAIADADVQHNYRVLLAFRDFLVDAGTLEAAYLRIIRGQGAPQLPMLFMDQMVHAILRQILKDVDDPMQVRAAELFFREQTVSTDDGRIMLADEDTVDMVAQTGGMGGLGQLLAQNATPARQVELDVLHEDNKQDYWQRSDRFDTVIDLRFTQPALDAFARVIERWVAHFLKVTVKVQPVQRIDDENWRWHIGLDAKASDVLNRLYQGEEAWLDDQAQIIALFNMQIEDRAAVIETVRGRPVYLGLAMSADGKLRMKPQNLLVNMPLEQAA
ncbi:MAG: hypothetical protein HKN11_10180 [Rhizobiales bacterium]|nr:hypothetical protein [Hyphomicrobiales bacterium]